MGLRVKRRSDETVVVITSVGQLYLPVEEFPSLEVGSIVELDDALSREEEEKIKFIKDNLNTLDQWDLDDFKEFYTKDINFLLGLL